MSPTRDGRRLQHLVGAMLPGAIASFSSSSASFFSGSQLKVDRGQARVVCRKPDIHPKFYSEAKVYCKGELVMTTGGTQPEYVVDIWSGNHPFFQGQQTGVLLDADQVEKWRKKFGEITVMNQIPNITKSVPKFDMGRKKDKKGKKK